MKRFKITYKRFKKVWGYADLTKNEISIDSNSWELISVNKSL